MNSIMYNLLNGDTAYSNCLDASNIVFFGDSWTDSTWESTINYYASSLHNTSKIRHWTDIVGTSLGKPYINTAIHGTSPSQYLANTYTLQNKIYQHKPSHVFFMFGCNDMIVEGTTPQVAINHLRTLIADIRGHNIRLIPVFYGVIPYCINELASGYWSTFTNLYRSLMSELELPLIDLSYSNINLETCFYSDGLHLNCIGNFYAAEYILKRLEEITNQNFF